MEFAELDRDIILEVLDDDWPGLECIFEMDDFDVMSHAWKLLFFNKPFFLFPSDEDELLTPTLYDCGFGLTGLGELEPTCVTLNEVDERLVSFRLPDVLKTVPETELLVMVECFLFACLELEPDLVDLELDMLPIDDADRIVLFDFCFDLLFVLEESSILLRAGC